MHFHFPVSTGDILWTLTFAGYLVLLVVLMGRDRIARFPWFTASIVLMALRILTVRLLVRRLPPMTMNTIFIVMTDLVAVVGLLVVVEIARRAFGKAQRAAWLTGALALMVLGGVVLKFWGPWPSWSTLTVHSTIATLRLLQFIAQKFTLLASVEAIAVGLLIVMLGSRYKAGWRSHTRQIAIGLSTTAIAQLAIQGIWQSVVTTAQANPVVLQSMTEQQRVMALGDKLSNTNSTIYVAILIWWIVCLWRDEPGTMKTLEPAQQPDASPERAETIEAVKDNIEETSAN